MPEADATWRDLFPDGRVIFYEGDDPEGFRAQIRTEFGFDPGDTLSWEMSYSFHCPPEYLDAIYGGSRWPMGS